MTSVYEAALLKLESTWQHALLHSDYTRIHIEEGAGGVLYGRVSAHAIFELLSTRFDLTLSAEEEKESLPLFFWRVDKEGDFIEGSAELLPRAWFALVVGRSARSLDNEALLRQLTPEAFQKALRHLNETLAALDSEDERLTAAEALWSQSELEARFGVPYRVASSSYLIPEALKRLEAAHTRLVQGNALNAVSFTLEASSEFLPPTEVRSGELGAPSLVRPVRFPTQSTSATAMQAEAALFQAQDGCLAIATQDDVIEQLVFSACGREVLRFAFALAKYESAQDFADHAFAEGVLTDTALLHSGVLLDRSFAESINKKLFVDEALKGLDDTPIARYIKEGIYFEKEASTLKGEKLWGELVAYYGSDSTQALVDKVFTKAARPDFTDARMHFLDVLSKAEEVQAGLASAWKHCRAHSEAMRRGEVRLKELTEEIARAEAGLPQAIERQNAARAAHSAARRLVEEKESHANALRVQWEEAKARTKAAQEALQAAKESQQALTPSFFNRFIHRPEEAEVAAAAFEVKEKTRLLTDALAEETALGVDYQLAEDAIREAEGRLGIAQSDMVRAEAGREAILVGIEKAKKALDELPEVHREVLLNLDAKLAGAPAVFHAPYDPHARYITQRFERSAELVFIAALALRRAALLAVPEAFRQKVLAHEQEATEQAIRLLLPCHVRSVVPSTTPFYEANLTHHVRADAFLACHRVRVIEPLPTDATHPFYMMKA